MSHHWNAVCSYNQSRKIPVKANKDNLDWTLEWSDIKKSERSFLGKERYTIKQKVGTNS